MKKLPANIQHGLRESHGPVQNIPALKLAIPPVFTGKQCVSGGHIQLASAPASPGWVYLQSIPQTPQRKAYGLH